MKSLCLEDLKGNTQKETKEHIATEYKSDGEYGEPSKDLLVELLKYNILIAYESVGSWGCDSSSWFLLRDKKTKVLYEVHGSHCSCYGFEGQWTPEETTLEYLQSDKFDFSAGGYDSNESANREAILTFIKKMRQ